MLGDLLTRSLVLVLGYAYPAFQCFKTVEKNKVQIDELRFWCQYWIIVALVTVFERIGDLFISWVPMYGEIKLGLIIYLWYPRTKGTSYVYETFLRPYVAAHETDIERKVEEWRTRSWDLAVYYWQNCTELGQTAFFQVVEYLASPAAKFTNPKPHQVGRDGEEKQQQPPSTSAPGGKTSSSISIFRRSRKKQPSTSPPRQSSATNNNPFQAPNNNLNLGPIQSPHNIHPHH